MKVLLCWPYRQKQDICDIYGNQLYINADQTWHGFPLGIGYIGSYLHENGVEVKCYDFSFHTKEEVMNIIRAENPDVLGITCLTAQRASVWDMFKFAKENNNKCITVMGGHHASIMGEQTVSNFPYVDYCVYGDGAHSLYGICKSFRVSDIPGLIYMKDGSVVKNDPLYLPLDEYPFMNYELFNWDDPHLSSYYKDGNIDLSNLNYHIISCSRGCYAHCKFCCVTDVWDKYTTKSPMRIVDEIEYMISKYGPPKMWFKFVDETFNAHGSFIKELCTLITERKLDIKWETYLRGDITDSNTMGMLRSAGLFHAPIGVESGSQIILDNIDKGLTVEKIRDTIHNAHYHGINTFALMIVGAPGETQDTIDDTKRLLLETKPGNVGISYYTIFPGTKLYEDCKELGIIDDDYWLTEKYPPLYTYEKDFPQLKKWGDDVYNTWNKHVLSIRGYYDGTKSKRSSNKLSGYTIVSDDMLILPCIQSMLDVCDEVIVVANNPSELVMDTISSISKLDERVVPIVLDGDFYTIGEDIIRNVGIDKCTGDWILELDSDEILYEGQADSIRDIMRSDKDYHIFNCYQMCGDHRHMQFLRRRNIDIDPYVKTDYGWGVHVPAGYTGSKHITMYRNNPGSHYVSHNLFSNGIHSFPSFRNSLDWNNDVQSHNEIKYVHYSLCYPNVDIYSRFLMYRLSDKSVTNDMKVPIPMSSIPIDEGILRRTFQDDIDGENIMIHNGWNMSLDNPLDGEDFTVMTFHYDHPIYMKYTEIMNTKAFTYIDDHGIEHIMSRGKSYTNLPCIGDNNSCNVLLDYHKYDIDIPVDLKRMIHSFDIILARDYYTFTAEACSINDNVFMIAKDPDHFRNNYLDIVHDKVRLILTTPTNVSKLLNIGAPINKLVYSIDIDDISSVMRFAIDNRRS